MGDQGVHVSHDVTTLLVFAALDGRAPRAPRPQVTLMTGRAGGGGVGAPVTSLESLSAACVHCRLRVILTMEGNCG